MADSFRALCAELTEKLHEQTSLYDGHEIALVQRARTQLAQPEGERLTDEELLKVFLEAKAADMRRQGGLTSSDANGIAKQLDAQTVAGIRAVLAHLLPFHALPVPTSEEATNAS